MSDHDDGLAIDGADETVPWEEQPSRRKPRVRGKTFSMKRLSKRRLEIDRLLNPDVDIQRPVTREDCTQGEHATRPCPFVSCKHNLFLDVNPESGAIKINFPNLELHELTETCALDVADREGVTLEEVGSIMNLTRERVRQLETRGVTKLKAMNEIAKLAEFLDGHDVVRGIEPENKSFGDIVNKAKDVQLKREGNRFVRANGEKQKPGWAWRGK